MFQFGRLVKPSLLIVGLMGVICLGCSLRAEANYNPCDGVRPPTAKAYLGNNPKFKLIPWRHPDGTVDEIESVPSLVVDLENLPVTGLWHVEATVLDKKQKTLLSAATDVSSKDGRIHWTRQLDAPLSGPYNVRLRARKGSYSFERVISLPLYHLFGKVTDFAGKPVRSVVDAVGLEGVATITDDEGMYSLWLPAVRMRALQAYDAGYGKTTLECWIYDYSPKEDLHLDLRIGQIEIYELRAWRGFLGIKMDFLPMSLSCVLSSLKHESKRGRFAPDYSREDMDVSLGGAVSRILSVDRRKEMLSGSDTMQPREEYSLHIPYLEGPENAERGELQVLKVVLHHQFKEGGREFMENGEGFYLGLRNDVGANGGMDY